MISLVAQCGKCGVRWATGAVRNTNDLGFAVTMLSASITQGAPICLNCTGSAGATASDLEAKQFERSIELARGTNLPECPYCEVIGRELVELDKDLHGAEASEELECCEEGIEVGWWGPPSGTKLADGEKVLDIRWHRKSLEERPS